MSGWCPPEQIELPAVGAVVRRYRAGDADALHDVIEVSRDHLRPFMAWADQSREDTRRFVAQAVSDWDAGRNWVVGIFDRHSGALLGGSGLHRRSGPEVLEIGYWRAVDAGGRGLVTATAGALTAAALTDPGVERVEIRCDVANRASAAVPRRLGYALREVVDKAPLAPAETGRHQVWSTGRRS